MSNVATIRIHAVLFLAVVLFTHVLGTAQDDPPVAPPPPPPEGPVPAQLMTAKKVFISNLGAEGASETTFSSVQLAQPYSMFYAAMSGWGRFDLVSSPADADLVFEIRFVAPMTDCGKLPSYYPEFVVAVVDAKTNFVLWTLSSPVGAAYRKETIKKNIGLAMTKLVDDLKKIAGPPATAVAGN